MKTIIATIAATAAVISLSTSIGHATPATNTKTTVVIENGECYTLFNLRFSCDRQQRRHYYIEFQQMNPFPPGGNGGSGPGRGERGGANGAGPGGMK